MVQFDIIVVSYNRANVLKRLFDSFPNPLPKELKEILILSIEKDDATQELITQFSKQLPINNITAIEVSNPGKSRNLLIEKASAEYLCFIDDDAQCPEDYFSRCINVMNEKIDLFGGPDQSPPNDSAEQKIIGEILKSKFVMGPTYQRHSTNTKTQEDAKESQLTLCNMWIKRELFVSNKLKFNESLRRCEENQLLEEFKSLGYNFAYYPYLYVYHFRREKLSDIARIQFLSGYYRSVCFFLNKENFKFFFFAPIATGFIISFMFLIPTSFLAVLFLLHILLSVIILVNNKMTKSSVQNFFWAWLVIITIHVFFSLGSFWGVVLGWKQIERDQT